MPPEDRHEHRQAVAVEADGDAARHRQLGLVDERLHLDEEAARALDGDVHGGAGRRRRLAQEKGGGVGHRLEARPRHLEDAELVGGAEPVLGGAQRAVEAVAVALELEHRVDHVLQHPGAGDRALLGHVPDEEDGGAGVLGQAQEAARRFAHLAHAARRRRERVAVERLHGVDDDERRARGGDGLEDGLELGLGEDVDVGGAPADALGAHLDLRRRLLAADEQRRPAGGDVVEHLQEQRGLADAGLAADQHERARDDAAAEHAVELVDAAREPLGGRRDDLGQTDGAGGSTCRRPRSRSWRCGRAPWAPPRPLLRRTSPKRRSPGSGRATWPPGGRTRRR